MRGPLASVPGTICAKSVGQQLVPALVATTRRRQHCGAPGGWDRGRCPNGHAFVDQVTIAGLSTAYPFCDLKAALACPSRDCCRCSLPHSIGASSGKELRRCHSGSPGRLGNGDGAAHKAADTASGHAAEKGQHRCHPGTRWAPWQWRRCCPLGSRHSVWACDKQTGDTVSPGLIGALTTETMRSAGQPPRQWGLQRNEHRRDHPGSYWTPRPQ